MTGLTARNRLTRYGRVALALPLLLALVLAGCSDNPVQSTNEDDDATGLIHGGVDPEAGDFEYTVDMAGDVDRPFAGPFVIRGRNIHYDESLGALVADLSVLNRSRHTIPEPVGLTFIDLLPDGVEVLNPDNNVNGPGAAIEFQFENDDAMWTPGEESIPRPVQFATQRGQAVAFVARIDVGDRPVGGMIGGVVWHDTSRDGVMDADEPGIPGVEILMTRGDGPETPPEILYRTLTRRDGSYRFYGLPAGLYVVTKAPHPKLEPTTPTRIQVILVDDDGDVSDFLAANFGCVTVDDPVDPPLKVGDHLAAVGGYAGDIHALVAHRLEVTPCDVIMPVYSTMQDDSASCRDKPRELRGTITGLRPEARAFEILGAWVHVPNTDDLTSAATDGFDDLEVGDRVRVAVEYGRGPLGLIARRIGEWEEDADVVLGFVQWIEFDANGMPRDVVVLDVRIRLPELTVVRP